MAEAFLNPGVQGVRTRSSYRAQQDGKAPSASVAPTRVTTKGTWTPLSPWDPVPLGPGETALRPLRPKPSLADSTPRAAPSTPSSNSATASHAVNVGTTRRRAVFFFFFVSRVAKSRRVIVHNVSVLIIFIPMWPISHLGQLKGLFFRKSQSIFPLATISSQTMVVYFRFRKRKNTSLFVTPFQPAGAREGAVLDCDLTFKSIMSGGKVVEISLWNKIIIKKTLKIIFKNEKIYIRHEAKPNQTTKPKIFINKKQQKK